MKSEKKVRKMAKSQTQYEKNRENEETFDSNWPNTYQVRFYFMLVFYALSCFADKAYF